MASLEHYLPLLSNQDTKKRVQLGMEILNYLEDTNNTIELEELGMFIDSITQWINSSNFKVAQHGLEILGHFADRMKEDFKPYLNNAIPAAIDRLGDAKDSVRDQARVFIMKLNNVTTPQHLFEKLHPAFTHKNWKVREELLNCLQETLKSYGAPSLSISKLMPVIVKLLGDPNSQVRDTAMSTLVEIYRHVGEKVRNDLGKKYNVPVAKYQLLCSKFDELKFSRGLAPSALMESSHRADDEADSSGSSTRSTHHPTSTSSVKCSVSSAAAAAKRATSAPPVRRGGGISSRPPLSSSSGSGTAFTKPRTVMTTGSRGVVIAAAGGADEEMFIRSFEDVPRIQVFSGREIDQELSKVKSVLADASQSWEKRVENLKKIRSIMVAGAQDYDEFFPNLKLLHLPFQVSVKDLRSQVVREACITIAYLSQQLGPRLDQFAEALMPCLINLIPNSAKIMSTAGIVAIRFIIQYTHASRLIPILANSLNSKSKEIRKTCCEFLDQLLHTWPTYTLERHITTLQDAIKKGISDADSEARACARKAFWGFADHFKDQADSLLSSLDTSKQRMLQGEMTMSNSSSSNSLNLAGRRPSQVGSVENLRGFGTPIRRSGIPILSNGKADAVLPSPLRSNSAIDLAAARRAKSQMYNYSRGIFSRPPSRASGKVSASVSAITSPERVSRSRTKGVSQSQPSSRSGSPSSRLSYATYQSSESNNGHGTTSRSRRKSGIPTPNSRDPSPSRSTYGGYERRLSAGSRSRSLLMERNPPTTITSTEPLMAERILQQSQEAEVAMADALVSAKRRYNAFEDQSDESETSSVCSDRSFNSYGRNIEDISEAIHALSSVHWSEKKEGLLTLQMFLHSGRSLSVPELRRVTEMFNKMFMDPHTKVFNLFLDTLYELLLAHKQELNSWLYILLSRLFVKLGTDILGSIQAKIMKMLDLIREIFTSEDQFAIVIKFLNDQTQTPNLKVKISVLVYFNQLVAQMDPSSFSSFNQDHKMAVIKLLNWGSDPKSAELRRHAHEVIVALFNLNSPEFTALLNQLPKNYQETGVKMISNQMRKNQEVLGPPIGSLLNSYSPNTSPRIPCRNINRSFEREDTENLNPEEIYNSLKRTADEIQKYRSDSFEKDQKLSQDSDFNQVCTIDGRLDTLKESEGEKPYRPNLYQDQRISNGFHSNDLNGSEQQESYFTIVISELKSDVSSDQKKKALSHLITLTKEGSQDLWEEHFRQVLRLIIDTVGNDDSGVRTMALRTLCELIKHRPQHFQDFIELTILKILEANKDVEKDVLRAAEVCAGIAASMLPPEQTARTLKPIILTGEYPVNLAAIKMFTKLVEQQASTTTLQLLPDLIPAIIKAYDSIESSVRKAAVFSMVAIYGVVGEQLYPHLSGLNGSKLKLLNLYIRRAQGQSSGSTPGSPANPPSSSS